MTIEEAIKTALGFEKKVHAQYEVEAKNASDAIAKRIFATLAQEEQGHVAYLESRLAEWQKSGRLSPEQLRTVLPSAQRIRAGIGRARAGVRKDVGSHDAELASLYRALAAEDETSAFYLQHGSRAARRGPEPVFPLSGNRGWARGHRAGRDRQREAAWASGSM